MLDVMAGPPGEPENLMLPVDHHVSGGIFLEGVTGALIDAIPHNLSRLHNPEARVRRRRAEHAARERRPDIVASLEEAVLPIENGKKSALAGNSLRRPEEQIAARPQGVVKGLRQAILQRGVQIDQQVAARYQVEFRKRRVPGNIVYREDA